MPGLPRAVEEPLDEGPDPGVVHEMVSEDADRPSSAGRHRQDVRPRGVARSPPRRQGRRRPSSRWDRDGCWRSTRPAGAGAPDAAEGRQAGEAEARQERHDLAGRCGSTAARRTGRQVGPNRSRQPCEATRELGGDDRACRKPSSCFFARRRERGSDGRGRARGHGRPVLAGEAGREGGRQRPPGRRRAPSGMRILERQIEEPVECNRGLHRIVVAPPEPDIPVA